MDTQSIIGYIEEEITRLRQARAVLSQIKVSRNLALLQSAALQKNALKSVVGMATSSKQPKVAKRVMSAEGRARIAAAQRLRWAKNRRAAKKAAKQPAALGTGKQAPSASVSKSVKTKRAVVKSVVSNVQ